jgi:hypothetical protein
MKELVRSTLASLSLIVVWAMGPAYAQSVPVIKVNIPFEFSFGDKTFPSGSYSLAQPRQHFLVLRDARGQTIASTFTEGLESSAASATGKLTFRSVDGVNVLTEVRQQDDSSGERLPSTNTNSRSYIPKHGPSEARQVTEGSQP